MPRVEAETTTTTTTFAVVGVQGPPLPPVECSGGEDRSVSVSRHKNPTHFTAETARLAGSVTSEAKSSAARANGRKGGRPRNVKADYFTGGSRSRQGAVRSTYLLERSMDLWSRVVFQWIGLRQATLFWQWAEGKGMLALGEAFGADPEFRQQVASGDVTALARCAAIVRPVQEAHLAKLLDQHRALMLRKNPQKLLHAEEMMNAVTRRTPR